METFFVARYRIYENCLGWRFPNNNLIEHKFKASSESEALRLAMPGGIEYRKFYDSRNPSWMVSENRGDIVELVEMIEREITDRKVFDASRER